MTQSQFSSDGFDLDAIAANDGDDVVYEIGGGATVVAPPAPEKVEEEGNAASLEGIEKAEDWKKQGNEQFKQGQYLEAYDLYTEAIMECPGKLKGGKILKMRTEFNEKEREKAMSRQRLDNDSRNQDAGESSTAKPEPPAQFSIPKQEHGDKLAIYYCNRAAALHNMERYEEAIMDCDVSTLLNPQYTKAYVRRSTAYEKSERTEEALRDAKKALELDPANATIRKNVARLQKIEDERLEKLKEETMGKYFDHFTFTPSMGPTSPLHFRFQRLDLPIMSTSWYVPWSSIHTAVPTCNKQCEIQVKEPFSTPSWIHCTRGNQKRLGIGGKS